jgi:hypothetical protein
MLSISSTAAGAVACGGAGTRSESEVEREGFDQDIELLGFEVIVPSGPVQHEERSAD